MKQILEDLEFGLPTKKPAPRCTMLNMREVPRDQWRGPDRMRASTLDMIMIPGNKWYELEAGVDFRKDLPFLTIRQYLYGAARRRGGGELAVYQTPEGNIRVYATGCRA